MTVWNYIAGRRGLHEAYVMGNGRVHMSFNLDRSALWFDRRRDLRNYLMNFKWPDQTTPQETAAQDAGNLWRFSREAELGDVVVMRCRTANPSTVAIGEIAGDYHFDPGLSAGENQPGPSLSRG